MGNPQWSPAAGGTDELTLAQALVSPGSLTDDASTNPGALRDYCGALLRSPQFLMAGLPPWEDGSTPVALAAPALRRRPVLRAGVLRALPGHGGGPGLRYLHLSLKRGLAQRGAPVEVGLGVEGGARGAKLIRTTPALLLLGLTASGVPATAAADCGADAAVVSDLAEATDALAESQDQASSLAELAKPDAGGALGTSFIQALVDAGRWGTFDLDEPVGLISLNVELDVEEMTAAHLIDADVGHTWLEFEPWDDLADRALAELGQREKPESIGFYPGEAFSLNPLESVPGRLNDPDPHRGDASHQVEFPITLGQLLAVYDYAMEHRSAEYNLYTYNCTTFAVEALRAANVAAPSGDVLGVDFPNALAEKLVQLRPVDAVEPLSIKDSLEDNYK